ncbi:ABC-F type ribosomal protection protein [Pullulanibacillus sp. KACC 23026]|uniref:ribosomal protection-like ABC-F family protein n=1 Tax=Pullulanibacillus sp. KACC 23026 TaxID=3028315 RepID=UPI0023B10908|nr:ABC-F type ribosomal protection protein [Pullulanibacillus sp. KACC 23026]WEG14798.1 ABC-F type ribosomal protection protein [Pullulanibacillus sp. KACC 23026]
MIRLHKVSKSFGGNPVFEEMTLEVNQSERVGIVGRNGTGKTTLFKLIASMEKPDKGNVFVKKGLKIGYLAQIPDFSADTTVYQVLQLAFSDLLDLQEQLNACEVNMATASSDKQLAKLLEKYGPLQEEFQRLGGYEVDHLINQVLYGLAIHELKDHLFSELSGGQQTKVSLGHLLLTKPDLLLLDEPTNHLDLTTVEWLESYLQAYEGTMLIISHDRSFLDEVVTKIVEIEEGNCHSYQGNYSYYVIERERRLLAEFAAYQEQQKKIQKMKETIKRLKEWANQANPPNDGMHRRAKSMEKALERMEKLNRPIINPKQMNLEFELNERSGKDVLYLEKVTHGFDNAPLFENLALHIQYKEHVAIVGQNGSGKSTLLKFITQELVPSDGRVKLGTGIKIGYLSQHVFLKESMKTVIEAFREEVSVTVGEARHLLAKFLFYGETVFRPIGSLSGGERMRLKLAQLMHQDINFLVLDEPTNHLDIESREILEDAVNHFSGTVLAVSHDRFFLNKCFSITYWLENKHLIRFEGSYKEAKEKREKVKRASIPETIHAEKASSGKARVTQNISLETIEQAIVDTELEIDGIKKQMQVAGVELQRLSQLQMELERMAIRRDDFYLQLEEKMKESN